MTLRIPYTSEQLSWHLRNNTFLAMDTIEKIVEQCNLINMGHIKLEDQIAPNANCTVAEMLQDLKIDYTS